MDTLGMALVRGSNLDRGLGLLDDARVADLTDATIAYHYADALIRADRGPAARLILLELVSKPFPELAGSAGTAESDRRLIGFPWTVFQACSSLIDKRADAHQAETGASDGQFYRSHWCLHAK